MKTRRYSEVQIFRILQEVDAGSQVVDVARKYGVSPAARRLLKAGGDQAHLSLSLSSPD